MLNEYLRKNKSAKTKGNVDAQWLLTLPKPCGVMAYADEEARDVFDACRVAGIPIPEQISVIGIDNELDLRESSHPTLTRILPAFEQSGFVAAKELGRTFDSGRKRNTRILSYGIAQVVERASTRDVNG